MLFLPEAAGPSEPVAATIDRRPGSVRRTSSIDTARPDGFRGDLVMTARARDLRTAPDTTSVVIDQVDLSLRVDSANRQVLSIASSPALPDLDQLVGCAVGPGFRSRVNAACPGEREGRHPAPSVVGRPPGCRPGLRVLAAAGRSARSDSPAFQRRGRKHLGPDPADGHPGRPLRRVGPRRHPDGDTRSARPVRCRCRRDHPPRRFERRDDRLAWHAMPPLPPHAMRRRRRLDVMGPGGPGETHHFDAHFRDSHMDQDGGKVGRARVRRSRWSTSPGAVSSRSVPRPAYSRGWSAPGRWPAPGGCPACPSQRSRTRVRREFTGVLDLHPPQRHLAGAR